MAKKHLLRILTLVSFFWKLVPRQLRNSFILLVFILESRGKSVDNGLRRLFALEDSLQKVINERAIMLGNGEHPKHDLIPYHQFFIDNLADCSRIVDLGCGYGAVARSVAKAYPDANVIGIENDPQRFDQAIKSQNPKNLTFEFDSLHSFQSDEGVDGVILSNVLEHLEDRIGTLKNLNSLKGLKRIVVRVPSFERHWSVPLRRKLNVSYFQDSDHKIEHTLEEFRLEIMEAGLNLNKLQIAWGEIWAVCSPDSPVK